MSKKGTKKMWAIGIVVILAAAASIASVWWYMDTQLTASEARATSLSSQLASQAATADVAYLALTEGAAFTHDVGIDANGGVASDDTANEGTDPSLLIENQDTNDVATNVYITMWDLESSVGGVPSALEDTSMSFFVTYNSVLIPLYLNTGGVGEYTSGVNIGTLPVGGQVNLTLTSEVDAAADDTYDDSGADYTVRVYVYQSDAQSSTPASYTVST